MGSLSGHTAGLRDPAAGRERDPREPQGESFATGGFPHRGSPAPQSQPPAKGKCAGAAAVLGAVWGALRARGAAARPASRLAGEPREPGSDPGRRRGAGRPGARGKVGFARRKKHRWRRRSAIPGPEQAASSPVLTAVRPPPLNTRMRRPSARRGAGKREAAEAAAETEPQAPHAEADRPAGGAEPRRTCAASSASTRTRSQGTRGAKADLAAPLGLRRGPALLKAHSSTAGPGGPP